jgi:iron-sulfur cluster assembly protein
MNLTITPAAEKFMRRIVRFSGGAPQSGFRLKVSLGGCSGLSSEFSVEPAPLAGDTSFDCNGLPIFLPAESRLLLDGVTIDFGDTVGESGLRFRNPQAPVSTCSSHAAAAPASVSISVASIGRRS